MVEAEDVLFADEDAVVGFAVAAGEVVEVESGEGFGHGVCVRMLRWLGMRWLVGGIGVCELGFVSLLWVLGFVGCACEGLAMRG